MIKDEIEDRYGREASVAICDGSDVHEAVDAFVGVLVAYGYHPKSVEDGIIQKAYEYEDMYKDNPESI